MTLQAPFPWFGGKSRVAGLVWPRFGAVPNYIEPFAGSLAVLLGRPDEPGVETVNDIDGLLCNFWRAVRADPEQTAQYADWPVNECDLIARHLWLLEHKAAITERLQADPDFFDAKAAGWWCWGICSWIGSGWCSGVGPWQTDGERVFKTDAGRGVKRQLPHLGNAGHGVHRKLPHLGGVYAWFDALAARLRRVRVCCGDWTRVLGPGVTMHNGLAGVFLDPPYADTAGRDVNLYAHDCSQVAHAAREWAVANGGNPLLRIALCGYEGEHVMPADWECVAWKAQGGYARRGNANNTRERIWFSPHCLRQSVKGQILLQEAEE